VAANLPEAVVLELFIEFTVLFPLSAKKQITMLLDDVVPRTRQAAYQFISFCNFCGNHSLAFATMASYIGVAEERSKQPKV
jgi:hypothetical protein